MYLSQVNELESLGKTEGEHTVIFNKLTGALLSCAASDITELVNTDYCVSKVVSFDPKVQVWVGDYETGSVVYHEAVPREATERMLDAQAGENIRKTYDYYHQLNILHRMVSILSAEVTGVEVEEFNDMVTRIAEVRDLNEKYKMSYQEDPAWTYLNKTDEAARRDAQVAGGFHEVIGPRQGGL